ncbi:arabinogalactan protein 1-like [Miscanthus floridulus]|uniref:arabinogalactan protein 1-like n=1 Tax=Miscanthus floridulus TaxID=154761 RepID=UPI00345B2ADE
MQADKEPAAAAAAAPAAGKPPSICDRLQRAFHARPAFRPLHRLTVRHQDGGGAAKPAAGAGDGANAAPGPAPKAKHSGPPLPAAPRSLTPPATAPQAERPVPVRLPAVTSKVAVGSGSTGPPVPVPPPDVMAGMATAADAKTGDISQQTTGKTRVSSRVRKALSSK